MAVAAEELESCLCGCSASALQKLLVHGFLYGAHTLHAPGLRTFRTPRVRALGL